MKRIWFALINSINGIKVAWKNEQAFKDEILLMLIMVPAAIFLAPDKISFILMVGSLLLVLALELMNTGVEAAIDRIGEEIHPLSKIAKDTASAAVLIAWLMVVFVWVTILFF
jgi:diacylglycerol kinase (ATP)